MAKTIETYVAVAPFTIPILTVWYFFLKGKVRTQQNKIHDLENRIQKLGEELSSLQSNFDKETQNLRHVLKQFLTETSSFQNQVHSNLKSQDEKNETFSKEILRLKNPRQHQIQEENQSRKTREENLRASIRRTTFRERA